MKLELSFVVLLAGYIFVTRCNWTRFVARQQDGYRILFSSGVAGVVLLAISYVMVTRVSWSWARATWNSLSPSGLEDPVSRSICFALLLSVVLVSLINRIVSARRGLTRAIIRGGNRLEILLVKSLKESEPVEIVLKGDIVFSGIVIGIGPPENRANYLELDPLLQGFVDSNGITKFQSKDKQSNGLVLPLNNIHRAQMFPLD